LLTFPENFQQRSFNLEAIYHRKTLNETSMHVRTSMANGGRRSTDVNSVAIMLDGQLV